MRRLALFMILLALFSGRGPADAETRRSAAAPETAAPGAPQKEVTIGTFNIKMFPCGDDCACMKREAPAFRCRTPGKPGLDWNRLAAAIREVSPDILGVNEILNPQRLERFAREHLGPSWKFAWTEAGGPQKIGFLYNSETVTIRTRKTFVELFSKIDLSRHENCLRRAQSLRPAFACRFRVRNSPHEFIVAVVHLKSGNCHGLRLDQWGILRTIAEELISANPRVTVLGDFNDYGGKEPEFSGFCEDAHFHCVTGGLKCSYLYSGSGRAIDGILVSPAMRELLIEGSARVGGACAAGCGRSPAAEAYRSLVSDHCPVTARFRVPR
jgi:endonuclease/exonuclease/phosphatase family metal-dependent hydrolase